MSRQHLQFAVKTELSVAIQNLEHLIECLKRRTIFIAYRKASILLRPMDPVNIELKARSSADRSITEERIVLTLKWEIAESWQMGKTKPPVLPPAGTGRGSVDLGSADPPERIEAKNRMRRGEKIIRKSGNAAAVEHRRVSKAIPRTPAGRGAKKTKQIGRIKGRQA